MLHIDPLVTNYLNVRMREIPIGEALRVCLMDASQEQAGITAFLRACIDDGGPRPDPAHWTVQERFLAMGHYLMAVFEDEPDFSIGQHARFSDYLDPKRDIPKGTLDAAVPVGEIEGDQWSVQHLTGAMAQAVERLQGQVQTAGDADMQARLHWRFGCMAAQLVRTGEDAPPLGDGAYDDWLMQRMRVLLNLPESAAAQLVAAYEGGKQQLQHLFDVQIGFAGGLVVYAREDAQQAAFEQKGAEAVLPPATFPLDTAVSEFARAMVGKHAQSGL